MTHNLHNFPFSALPVDSTVAGDSAALVSLAAVSAILLVLLMLALGTLTIVVVYIVVRKRIEAYKGQCDVN